MENILDIVRPFSQTINNGRSLHDIARHTESELVELYEEIEKKAHNLTPGKDGIVGEAIDIIACALDAIVIEQPDITYEEICATIRTKCEKWARRYKDSVDGDRSID
jgi:hypothetical protein